MKGLSRIKLVFTLTVLSVAMSCFCTTRVLAESAPVYDADAMPYDNDQGQDYPPPPPPQESSDITSQPPGNVGMASARQPASASLPPVMRLNMAQRVQRVEQQISNMQNSDASSRIASLQDQVQSLQGQVEQLTHQLQQLQGQIKTQYQDLDKRLTDQRSVKPLPASEGQDQAETAPKPKKILTKSTTKVSPVLTQTTSTPTPKVDQPNVAEEQEIYQTAYNMIKAKKYNEAVTALQGMLRKYPSGQFASNAHYWLGELYGLMGKNDLALGEFSTVVKTFPDSPRVSDAQLKVGLILASQSKWPEAKAALKKVINHYPGTASARLASENLKQIQQQANQ